MTNVEWALLWDRLYGKLARWCAWLLSTDRVREALIYADRAQRADERSRAALDRYHEEKATKGEDDDEETN